MIPVVSIAERIIRFSVERVTATGVVEMTSASELWRVSENDIPRHFVAIGPDRAVCTTMHDGDDHYCPDAVAAVLAHKLADSLNAQT